MITNIVSYGGISINHTDVHIIHIFANFNKSTIST